MQLDSSVESILLEPSMPNTIASNVVIAEVFYDAVGSDTGLEYMVLYNPTDSPVNLKDWRIQAGGPNFLNTGNAIGTPVPGPTVNIIAPHGYFLIGEGPFAGGLPVDHRAGAMSFQNGDTPGSSPTDGIRIIDAGSRTIDTLLYDAPNDNNLDDNTGNTGNSYAPDVLEGHSLKRKSNSSGYIAGQGNGYQTNAPGNDFFDNPTPTPKNTSIMPEQYTGETEGNNYQPTFINTSKRGPSTSLGFWQIGSNEQHGLTHAPVFKMVFQDIRSVITEGVDTDTLTGITGIKIWGVGNTNDDGVVFPLRYISNNPKLDIYLNKFQFVNDDGEARSPVDDFMITGYKKKTYPIAF